MNKFDNLIDSYEIYSRFIHFYYIRMHHFWVYLAGNKNNRIRKYRQY